MHALYSYCQWLHKLNTTVKLAVFVNKNVKSGLEHSNS